MPTRSRGRRADAHRLLGELDELAERRYVSPWGRALIYLGLRDDRVSIGWSAVVASVSYGWLSWPRTRGLILCAQMRAFAPFCSVCGCRSFSIERRKGDTRGLTAGRRCRPWADFQSAA